MNKLDLKYNESVHIDKWDIDVVPYLTINQIQILYDIVKDITNPFERSCVLMADIITVCTDLYEGEDASYTYEEIMYSGLWNDILTACPLLKESVHKVEDAVREYQSVTSQIKVLIDRATEILKDVDINQLKGAIG